MKSPFLLLSLCVAWLSGGPTLHAGGVVQNCLEPDLRAALQDGGEVTFACEGTITLTEPIVITSDTTLNASGRSVTLNGGQSVRLFDVRSGARLHVIGLTLADGRAEAGAAVHCQGGTLLLDQCTLTGHQAIGSAVAAGQAGLAARGGAVVVIDSNVQLLACRFANNWAVGGTGGTSPLQGARGGWAAGGAVWIAGGSVRISDCRFDANEALGGNGGRGIQGGNGGDGLGGSIYVESGDLEVVRTEVTRSRARGGPGGVGTAQDGPMGGGMGGGACTGGGLMRLTACTVATCEAAGSPPNPAYGGGIANLATLLAVNTTVASNYTTMTPVTDSFGGGIYNEGFMTAEHCTVAANAATGGVQDKGGNLENAGGYVALRGTVIAYCKNQWDVFGGVIDQGGNICWDATAHFTHATSRNLVDPKLGPLADNGGPVRTMVPLPGSPAVDAVMALTTLTNDARGAVRPQAAMADAGAVEGAALAPVLSTTFQPAVVQTGAVTLVRVTLLNPNPFSLQGVSLRPALPAGFLVAGDPAPAPETGCGGTVQATPGATVVLASFPGIGPQESCYFTVPIVAQTPSTGGVAIATTTTANLGVWPGGLVSGQVRAMAGAGVVTLPAEFRPDGSVVLRGIAFPIGQGGVAYFEYGTESQLGSRTAEQTFATGVSEQAFEAVLPVLAGASPYHGRLVIVESGQSVAGNQVSFATPSLGAGTALFLDGMNDWVRIARDFAGTTNRFTIEFWAWPTASQVLPPWGEGSTGIYTDRPVRLAIYPSDGHTRYGTGHSAVGVSVGTNGVVVFERGKNLFAPVLIHPRTLTNWTHVAVVCSNGPPVLFIDGTKVRTGLNTRLVRHPSLEIGSTRFTPEPGVGFYQGSLDEVRIWDRALAEEELVLLARSRVQGVEPGLVACLNLDERTGSSLADATGHGFNGEAMNDPTWIPSTAPMGAGLVLTLEATAVTAQGAVLQALANAGGPGRVYFEWRVQGGAIRQTPIRDLAPGSTLESITESLTDLRPALTYEFRGVIEAAGGTQRGTWRTFLTGTANRSGYALRLAGGQDSVRVGTPFTNLVGDFTMEFWVRPTSSRPFTTESGEGVQDTAGQPFVFYPQYGLTGYGESDAVAGVAVGTNGVSVFEHGSFYRPSVLVHNASLSGWVHVAVVYRQRRPNLFLNGVQVRTGIKGTKTVHPSADLGCTTVALGGSTERPVGEVDEVRIWEGARSAEEIQANMHRQLTGTEAGLTLYYDFNAGPGSEVVDRSPATRRGAVAGAPAWVPSGAVLDSPVILATTASLVGRDHASISAQVDPRGFPFTAVVEWGRTGSYGHLTALPPIGGGNTNIQTLTETIVGLSPGTSYHYRLVLEDSGDFFVSGDRSFTTLPEGRGGALSFDGTDDFVTAQNVFGTVRDTFTIELWVKPSAGITLQQERQDSSTWPAGQRLALFPNEGTSAYGAGHATVGLSVGTNGINVIEHAASYAPTHLSYTTPLDRWTHVALVYVQGSPRLYLDGYLVRTGLTSRVVVHPGSSLGSLGLTGGYGFYAGLLDEVRIWNVARTEEQIRANRHAMLLGSEANLVRYWRFDGMADGTVLNISAFPDPGTLQGPSSVAADSPVACAYVDDVRVVASDANAIDLEVLVNGNGFNGSLQVEWGPSDAYGSTTDPIAVASTDVDRWVPVRIGRPGEGPFVFYRTLMNSEGSVSREFEGRAVVGASVQGTMLTFDGIAGEVSMPPEPFAGIDSNFTIEFWCRPLATRAESAESAEGAANLGLQRFVLYPVHGPSFKGPGSVGVGISVGSNGLSVVEHGDSRFVSVLVYRQPLPGWNHVAVVYVQGRARLYVNGVMAQEGLQGNLRPGPGFGLGGGASVVGTTGHYQGALDELRIWKRALTANELQAHLHEVLQTPQPDLVWCQHFDEGWGPAARDAAGTRRVGSLNSGVTWAVADWPAVPPPLLIRVIQETNGSIRFRFAAAPLASVVLLQSSDLEQWTPIQTNSVPANGVFEFVDAAPSRPRQFYRVKAP